MNLNRIHATFVCEVARPLVEKLNRSGRPWGYFLGVVGESTEGGDTVSVSVSEHNIDFARSLEVGSKVYVSGHIYLYRYRDGSSRANLNCASEVVRLYEAPEHVASAPSRAGARVMAEPEIPRWLKHDARGERRRDRRPSDRWEG